MSHSSTARRANRIAWSIVALLATSCARTRPVDESSVSEGTRLRGNRCDAGELMVVENRTGYPVRVRAVEDRVHASPGSSIDLPSIQSGTIDTVRGAPSALSTIVVFDVDRPALPSGAPMRLDGLTIRCVKS
jgi:hypothetical protein